jgi:hypothetical protein
METLDEALLRQARSMAKGLAITVHIWDGAIHQHEREGGPLPGDVTVDPPTGAGPELAGRGPIEGT